MEDINKTLDEKLEQTLKDKIVMFTYAKKDGTIRQAIGTLSEHWVPQDNKKFETLLGAAKNLVENIRETENITALVNNLQTAVEAYEPTDSTRKPKPEILTYYDMSAKGWRSCLRMNVQTMQVVI